MRRFAAFGLALLLAGVGVQAQESSLPWWNDRVFYEVFVRSFYDSDGDGTGDLQGLIQKLDYLNDGDPATHDDLGVTGLWLMPVAEAASYHGYDVTNYQAIEQDTPGSSVPRPARIPPTPIIMCGATKTPATAARPIRSSGIR